MFDDIQRLRDNARLAELLSHYVELARGDRTVWQDRCMHMEGVEPKELSRLHGDLIAFDWMEQNTGHTPVVKSGVVSACYRPTPSGIRDLARLRGEKVEIVPESPMEPKPSFPRKRKPKQESPEPELASTE